MSFNFEVDYDAAEVHIIVDDTVVLKVTKVDDNEFRYKGFDKLDDDDLQRIVKQATKLLLSFDNQ